MTVRPRLLVAALALSFASLPISAQRAGEPAAVPAAASASTAASAATSVRYEAGHEIFHPVRASRGMVASESALATQVGVEVLRRGGNAVDAAVAVGFALAVTLPYAGNLGGGGFLLLHDARRGQTLALDFREMAPTSATRDMYLDASGAVVPDASLYTHRAVGVPGSVAGLLHALERHGTLPRAVVMAPSIQLADDGFEVSPTLAETLAREREHLQRWEATRSIFFRGGRPLQAGERLVQRDLAASLRRIARRGAAGFYDGPVAAAIESEMKRHGGLVTREDLRRYRVVEREPVRGDYRGHAVLSMPPPSSGGVHLVQMLNLIERFPLRQHGPNSAQTVHWMTEAMKLAYADRSEHLGDPDFVKVPVRGLTSKRYADEQARGIDDQRARSSADIRPGRPQPHEGDQTTHYSVADAQGNVVAVTTTLNLNFGSGIVVPGTGILLNNEMDDFAAKPGVPNAFGLLGGEANAVQPGKRPLSSMSPTIVLKDGRPWLVTGSPGGARIITTVLQTLVNTIDFGMNPAEASATPRFHHQWAPDELRVERGFNADSLRLLQARGHRVVEKPTMGKTQTILLTPQGMLGTSDPRNPDGLAAGF